MRNYTQSRRCSTAAASYSKLYPSRRKSARRVPLSHNPTPAQPTSDIPEPAGCTAPQEVIACQAQVCLPQDKHIIASTLQFIREYFQHLVAEKIPCSSMYPAHYSEVV